MAVTLSGAYLVSHGYFDKLVRTHIKYKTSHADKYPWGEMDSEAAQLQSVDAKAALYGLELLKQDVKEFDANSDFDNEPYTYTYQGGFFQVRCIEDNVVRIFFPKIFTTSVLMQDMVCRSINRINSSYALCKLVAAANTQTMSVDVHGFADFPYQGEHDSRVKLLKDVMAVLFDMQRSLLVSMAVSETLEQDPEAPEPDEFSTSYKDISLN
ncbi:MAG: hypothetical protein NC217_01210 [Muribaculaceae bacterium]|nr:hypothetical protein [Muribaculaceae bacterium]